MKLKVTRAVPIALILSCIFLFTFPVSMIPAYLGSVFASGDESFSLINGMLLTTEHPITTIIKVNSFQNMIIHISGGSVNSTHIIPVSYADKGGSFNGTVSINMQGSYSSGEGMKGQYALLINGTVVSEGKSSQFNYTLYGPFSGPGGLAIGKVVTVSFGEAVGPPIAVCGETSEPKLDPFDVRFTVTGPENWVNPGAPGPVVDKLPPIEGEHLAIIEKLDGSGPVYVSNESEDVPPSKRKWVVATPKMPLGKNYSVRTGTGAEVLLRWSTGAVSRTKTASWFTIKEARIEGPGVGVMLGRLYQGIYNFYFPKGYEGARKFEIDLDRAVVGIKGTNLIIDISSGNTDIKVLEGMVEIRHKSSGATTSLEAGKSLSVTTAGLGQKNAFNVSQEQAKWPDLSSYAGKPFPSGSTGQPSSGQNTTAGQSSAGDKKKTKVGPFSCFIATAAYGGEVAQELDTLRAFRDKVLIKSEPGRWLVQTYYAVSPELADFIAGHEELRTVVRECLLDPVVDLLKSTQSCWNN